MVLTKKYLLSILLTFTLIFTASCRLNVETVNPIKSGEDITLFLATDIHYLSKSLTDNGEGFKKYVSQIDSKQLNYVDDIVNAFSSEVIKKRPDVLILSGDITYNGEKASHEDMAKKLRKIEEAGTSVFVIPGNHDIANPWARKFVGEKQVRVPSVSPKKFSKIYNDFGYSEAISRDEHTLSYLAAPSEDLWLLMIDTSQYESNFSLGHPRLDGCINQETFKWIKSCFDLAKQKNAKIIPVMHHNLLLHSDMLKRGYTLNNSTEVLKMFKEYDINLVLSGHIHVQDIKSYRESDYTVYDAVTSSLCVFPNHYGVIRYSAADGFDYSTSKTDVEDWAKKSGIKDENLRNFNDYAVSYIQNKAVNLANRHFIKTISYTEEQKMAMTDVIKKLNLRYFDGTAFKIKEEVINSKGYMLWKHLEPSFLRDYLDHIKRCDETDNNKLHISY